MINIETILLPFIITKLNNDTSFINLFMMLLMMLIISEFYSLRDIFSNLIKYINHYFCNRNNQIEFICSETKTIYGSGSIKMSSSDCFKAISLHIKNNCNLNNVTGLYNIKELTHNMYDYDEELFRKSNLKEIIYMANQHEKFYINNEKDIYYQISKISLDPKSSGFGNNNSNNEIGIFNNYKMIISSYNNSISYLQNHIDSICYKYYETIELKILENKQIFVFEGLDSDKQLKFNCYPFETTCNLEQLFFEDKHKIMNQINFFKNNKQWYIDKGKPYTLGICSWGNPGCGKTSFEKVITKYLDRHMIIVDLKKIKRQNELEKLFFDEKINNIKVPYDKRLYVFPDVDRMTDLILETKKKDNPDDSHCDSIIEKKYLINKLINISKDEDKINLNNYIKNIINESKKENEDNKLVSIKNFDEGDLSMAKLLNILDGIPERTGQVIMMSCNNPEKIDKAFLRPGRIDILIEFKKASINCLLSFINNYFDLKLDLKYLKKNYDEYLFLEQKWTPAEIFKICSQFKSYEETIVYLIKEQPSKVIYPF